MLTGAPSSASVEHWRNYVGLLRKSVEEATVKLSEAQIKTEELQKELESLYYAAELTREECGRRRSSNVKLELDCINLGESIVQETSAEELKKLESELLSKKYESASALYEVERMEFEARALERQLQEIANEEHQESEVVSFSPMLYQLGSPTPGAGSATSPRASFGPASPSMRSSAADSRLFIETDAVVQAASHSWTPYRVGVRADGTVVLCPCGRKKSLPISLTPPYWFSVEERLVDEEERELEAALSPFLAKLSVEVQGEEERAVSITGLTEAVADAYLTLREMDKVTSVGSHDSRLEDDGIGDFLANLELEDPPESKGSRKSRRFPVMRIPQTMRDSSILQKEHVKLLTESLPARFKGRMWKRIYSTVEDGISIQTFYRKAKGRSPSVLAVREKNGSAFGCFAATSWRSAKGYYGKGESFVFTMIPVFKVYYWTKKNTYFQFSNEQCIAMGGGSHFAVRLDAEFLRGSSGECETFGNPCLSTSPEFECTVAELWSLDLSGSET